MEHERTSETQEREPQVRYMFYFSAHGSRADAEPLAEQFQKADIFIPETAPWNEDLERAMNALSDGTLPRDKFIKRFIREGDNQKGFKRALVDLITDSHKKIAFADLPEGHELISRWHAVLRRGRKIMDQSDLSFDDMLTAVRDNLSEVSDIQKLRNEHLVQKLNEVVPQLARDIQREHPEKEEVSAVIALGANHSVVARGFADADVRFQTSPLVYGYDGEVERRLSSGNSVSREILARAWFGSFISRAYPGIKEGDTTRYLLAKRLIVDQFTVQEMESLYNRQREAESKKDVALAALAEKNITVPRTPNEEELMIETLSSQKKHS